MLFDYSGLATPKSKGTASIFLILVSTLRVVEDESKSLTRYGRSMISRL